MDTRLNDQFYRRAGPGLKRPMRLIVKGKFLRLLGGLRQPLAQPALSFRRVSISALAVMLLVLLSVSPRTGRLTPAERSSGLPLVSHPQVAGSEAPTSGSRRLVFDDSFTEPVVDTNIWHTQLRWGTTNPPELQEYTPEALNPQNGFLTLKADRNGNGGSPYTSGIIASYDHFYFQYGYIEIRAKVPKGRGLWPALWMLALDRQSAAEIDIMELLGHEPDRVYTTVHYGMQNGEKGLEQTSSFGPDYSQDYHIYAVDWNSERVIWYIDGKEVYRVTDHVPQEPMYIMANLAVGGAWPGNPDASTVFPAYFDISYIRVWQDANTASNTIVNGSFDDPNASPWYSPWSVRNDLGASITQDAATAANGTPSSMKISLPKSDIAQPWSVAITQFNQALTAGQSYTLTYWAKASARRPIQAAIQEQNQPYWQYGSQVAELSTDWKRFSYTFTALQDTNSAMLDFSFADAASDVWLDDVSLCQAGMNCAGPILISPSSSGSQLRFTLRPGPAATGSP